MASRAPPPASPADVAPTTAPAAPPVPTATLSGAQKCAILMLLFGEEQAACVLRSLGPRDVQALGQAMFSVADVSQDTVSEVLDEFIGHARAQTGVGHGADSYVRTVFTRALGEGRAAAVLARITPAQSNAGLDVLQWMDARAIGDLVAAEHPQIIAAVLGLLSPELAGEVLDLLPESRQADVVMRVARLESIPPEAIGELERVLQQQFSATKSQRTSLVGGVQAAAKIMNFTRSTTEQRVIRALFEEDEAIGEAIQSKMLTFEHLHGVDDRSLQTLMRAIESDVLVIALKGADERLRTRMLAGMTARAAQVVLGEMESLGPVRLSEVQEAQKTVLNKARALADEGTIMLALRSDDFV
jgi:flagellar motor switch protein FliG